MYLNEKVIIMRMEKLTSKFQMALADAQSLALGLDNGFIEPEHLLKTLLDQRDGSCKPILTKAGAQIPVLSRALEEALTKLPKVSGMGGDVHISNGLQRVLNLTDKLAQTRKDQYISSELFLLAALEDNASLAKLLKHAGTEKKRLRKRLMTYAAGIRSGSQRGRATPSIRKIYPRSHRTCRTRRARSCDRAR